MPLAQELIAVRGTKIKYAAGPLLDSTFPFPLAAPFPQSSPASPADAGKEIKKLAKYDGLIIDEGDMCSKVESRWRSCSPGWRSVMNAAACG